MLTKDILYNQAALCPLMQPTDAVKLVYQAAFGGGHLVRDEASCRRYILEEYASVTQTDVPLYDVISLPDDSSEGVVRVSLAALDAHSVTPERLADAFIASASLIRPDRTAFDRGLALLRDAAADGMFSFGVDELDRYTADYLRLPGLPPVSHSPVFRAAYAPHYRVICPTALGITLT